LQLQFNRKPSYRW